MTAPRIHLEALMTIIEVPDDVRDLIMSTTDTDVPDSRVDRAVIVQDAREMFD